MVYQKLAQKPSEEEEKYLRETAFELNRAYNEFIRNLETQYPDYYNLKFNTTSPSIRALQQRLPAGTAVVSYFIDDHNNRKQLYVYIITPKKFYIQSRTLPDNFDKLITGYRNSMFYLARAQFIDISRQLYRILRPRLPGTVNSLVILPTGRLGIIPFEALLYKRLTTRKPATINYPISTTGLLYAMNFRQDLFYKKTGPKPTTSILPYFLHLSIFPAHPSYLFYPEPQKK